MKRIVLLLMLALNANAEVWTVLMVDPKGDGKDPSLPDAAQLSYRVDQDNDMVWFRMSLYNRPRPDSVRMKIAVDTKILNGELRATEGAILLGVKRSDVPDKASLTASVGANDVWNDDLRPASIDLTTPRPIRGLRELDISRNNFQFPVSYKTLSERQSPQIVKKGHGPTTVILIPGVYSGKEVFDRFMKRNDSRYTFYVVTPPGLNGTPARALPAETTSYGEFTWTRRLERDVLDLIRKNKLEKPFLVAHGFPGSLVADEIATQHPDILGGIIDVSVMPVQFAPSMTHKGPATPEERIQIVNEAWAQQWFKYVTPETWDSNNYIAPMYTNDAARAEQVRQQVEAAPLQVKIRYLTEFMASDHSSALANLPVPLLALRPAFNTAFLSDPAHSYYKTTFQDSWDPFATNPRIKLVTIPDARALIFDDQPQAAEDAIANFVAGIQKH